MKKFIVNLVLLLLALILQILLPPAKQVFAGVKPDFLLITAVIIGLYWGVYEGMTYAFLAGLFQGVFLGSSSLIYIVVKTLSGGIAGYLERLYFKERYFFPPVIIFLLTFLHDSLVILLSETMLFSLNYFQALKLIILPTAILNALISLLLYYLYHRYWQVRGDIYE
ncbi:MAG TPA: rod shape-determining protein MreD [Halanaerobiaceae bacterium]|nr:rod shape-determining protein MreD [Bacillota bacterium]HHU93103.1 rod shape-determining protein MreD [Halanaerobiaceae bacterium]HOA41166.1 rod shape-determining protein MreD [Halanaerobiales bacterium]HPZ63224.1 rod shape-determining protein MreD [Halanaerobiales bacterium]HQD04450.1 rod shape-determining protein MreD [Halanaerobiales bacterium]